jgi:hypothetical protein
MVMRIGSWLPLSLAGILLGAGCAHDPAFQVELPTTIASDGKAIAIIGDLQQTSGVARFVRRREDNAVAQQQLVADLRRYIDELSSLVIVGDLVFSARSTRQWAHFDTLITPFAERMPVLPAIGNHDYPCFFVEFCKTSVIANGMLERFPWFAPGQPYAVSSGGLLFLLLDSESELEAQGEWLDELLRTAAGRYSAALVFFHRPPYTNSIDRGAEGNPAVQQFVVPRLQAARLPVVVFNGHVHGLEYIVRDGVHYLTTAGGGGPRGPIAAEQPFDQYRGPDCMRAKDGALLRPLNYLLLRAVAGTLMIEIRGFCGGDEAVRTLDRIEIPLVAAAAR